MDTHIMDSGYPHGYRKRYGVDIYPTEIRYEGASTRTLPLLTSIIGIALKNYAHY